MKKLLFALLAVFVLIPVTVMAVDDPPTIPTTGTLPMADLPYNIDIVVKGAAGPFGEGSTTTQTLQGLSYPMYTVVYTIMIDAMREIITKAWALEGTEGGITTQKLNALIANPKALYPECQ